MSKTIRANILTLMSILSHSLTITALLSGRWSTNKTVSQAPGATPTTTTAKTSANNKSSSTRWSPGFTQASHPTYLDSTRTLQPKHNYGLTSRPRTSSLSTISCIDIGCLTILIGWKTYCLFIRFIWGLLSRSPPIWWKIILCILRMWLMISVPPCCWRTCPNSFKPINLSPLMMS